MPDSSLHAVHLHQLLERARAGERAAREQLFKGVCARLEHLARKMLKSFPTVRRWEQAEDVVQNAMLRLLHALDQVKPSTVQDFYNLAAVHLRRELLDLARRFRSPKGQQARSARDLPQEDSSDPGGYQPCCKDEDHGEVDRWCGFHQAVECLPVEEREVVGLVYYHGWTQVQVAALFQVSQRTIRRRWESALGKLQKILKER
jgi:RNA polymerase sigma-70 factor (ECF subfamily)